MKKPICHKCKVEVEAEAGCGWIDEEIWDGMGVVKWLCDDCIFEMEVENYLRGCRNGKRTER